jgi:hypothetical protein
LCDGSAAGGGRRRGRRRVLAFGALSGGRGDGRDPSLRRRGAEGERAIEGQYEWVSGFDFVGTQDVPPLFQKGDTLARLQSHTVTANLKLLLPIWRIQPYLLAGIGGAYYVIDDKTGFGAGGDEWAFAGRVGVGGDLYLTKNLLAFVEVSGVLTTLDITAPTTSQSLTGLYYLSTQLGLQWRF